MKIDIDTRTFDFAVRIVRLAGSMRGKGAIADVIGRQVLRSGTSVGANIEEAQAGQSKADFITKMSIAHKEIRETNCWLRLLATTNLFPIKKLQDLALESDEISRIIATILTNTKKAKNNPKAT